MKKFTLMLSAMLFSVMSFAAVITFTPGEFDALESSKFDVVKDGVTLSCSSGSITADQFRFFKSQTLTVSSTAGNITSIEFTCTAANDTKHGPGGFGALDGYTYADKVGTWTGSAASVTFSTTNNQVRATQVVVTIDGEGGGETPETPEEPEDPETPEEPEEPVVGGMDGYTKVTNAASLVAGDKVVLYCDDAAVGVTGWNGNKDATVAETGWVEYVVEVADGGFYLKDGDQYITGAESANHFKYGEKAVCGVSDAGVLACGTKFLYKNGDYYRMYTDKSSNSAYKPFYVYKVGEGGGDNPGTGDNPGGETPETEVIVSGLDYAMAFYEEEEGFAYWEMQLFNLDATGENIDFPLAMVAVEAKSKTALNGTYDMLMAVYGTGEDAEGYVEGVYMSEDAAGTLTIKNVDNEGTYSFVGTFVGEDGKTYKLNTESFMVWVEDGATGEEIELNEEGGSTPGDDPVTPPVGGEVTFDADVDKGNASEDTSNQTPYSVSKDGITMDVTKGVISKYKDECHYRVYKNETLTLTSTVGNIVAVEFTCTANDAAQYGPGCLTASTGDYTYSGPVGTWTGNAASVVFTASTAQVRATQIVVKIAGGATGVEDVTTVVIPVKVMQDGQLMIIRGEKTYNVMGAEL